MNKLPPVSIIVVNWNGGEMFKKCLASISKLDYPNWELIVVDNGSTDGSDNYKFNHKKFKLIRNKTNLGFAPANNIGFQVSMGEYALFLNNDTTVPPDLLKKLMTRINKDDSIGVIQPKIRFMDNPGVLDNVGSFLTWTGFLTHVGFGASDSPIFNKERIIFSAKGACMLVRRSVIQQVGLFDNDFVSYFEETDFCWRVWLVGYKVLYFPGVSIEHKVGFTSERLIATEVNYHSFKNRISSMFKNLGNIELVKIIPIHLFTIEALSFYYLLSLKFSKFWMIQKAILWNINNINNLIKKRYLIQKMRTVKDQILFKSILKRFNFSEMLSHFMKVESNFISKKIAGYDEIQVIGRIRACLSVLKSQNLKNKVVVDVGCSTGFVISKIASEKTKRVVGIDPSKESIDIARKNNKNIEFFVSGADKIPVENNSSDLVTMFDVIEHVPQGSEKKVFKEVQRVLKKDGILLLSTPNSSLVTNLLDPAWYLGHRHYHSNRLKELIEQAGLKIKKIYIKGSVWSSFYMLWFYVSKWMFGQKNPRNAWLEKKEDSGYDNPGIFTIFVEAKK